MADKEPLVSTPYLLASGAVIATFVVVTVASINGWGLTSDAEALAKARQNTRGSVRSGSLHGRRFYGGGPSRGK